MRPFLSFSSLVTLTLFTFSPVEASRSHSVSRHKRHFAKRAESWSHIGCYNDPDNARVLPGFKAESNTMSIQTCQSTCQAKGFSFAGLEYGRECWCATSITAESTKATEDKCGMSCPSGSGKCGGSYAIDIYSLGATTSPSQPTSPSADTWTYLACYNDPDNARVLPSYHFDSDTLSVASCQSTCKNQGFTFAGVEYGRECWCASSLANSATKAGEDKCSMTCASGEKCGGSYAISVYSIGTTPTEPTPTPTDPTTPWVYDGCYNDPDGARVLPAYHFESDTLSVASCQSTCETRGFSIAGVEYGRECWCASSIAAGSTKTSEDQCGMTCASGSGQCGGSYAIGVYKKGTGTTPTDPDPTPDPTPGSWSYLACYHDPESARLLNGYSYTSTTGMTPEACTSACESRSFKFAALEYGQECWCGSSLASSATKANEADCSMPCSGQATAKCGASYIASVYTLSDTTTPPEPEPVNGKRSLGYYMSNSIYERQYPPSLIPAADLTHILYAFAKVDEDGGVAVSDPWADTDIIHDGDTWSDPSVDLHGNLKQLYLLKKQNRHLKIMLSIGGWNFSPVLNGVIVDATKRRKFVTTSVKLLEDLGLDGLDVDYEYPSNDEQARGYANLLSELRAALDAHAQSKGINYHFLISIAAPCGPYQYPILHIEEMDKSLDFWNMMAYDLAGPWNTISGHQAGVYGQPLNLATAIQHYIDHGVARDKINMGIPLYGRSFLNTNGPGAPFTGVGPGSWEEGVYDYRALPLPGAETFRDESLMASWTYNFNTKEMISYDDPIIAKLKGDWIKNQGLGGSMFWELSGDKGTARNGVSGPGKDAVAGESLVKAVTGKIGTLDSSSNWLQYGNSKYANVRNGMQ